MNVFLIWECIIVITAGKADGQTYNRAYLFVVKEKLVKKELGRIDSVLFWLSQR